MKGTKKGVIRITIVTFLSLIYLIPFYITIVNAFKTEDLIFHDPLGLPLTRMTTDNVVRNFNSSQFSALKAYGFTAFILILTLICVLVLASMSSYVLSRNRKGFYKVAYFSLLAGLFIPVQVIIIPIIQILRSMGLMFSFTGLILVFIAMYMPFVCFIFTGYIGTISPQFDESAQVEGASPFQIFVKIIFPLMKPAVVTVIIFVTIWTWNDFFLPYVIFGSGKFYTITTGIYRAIGQYQQKWDDVFAVLFLAITPISIFYIWLQKQFISGLTSGAFKG